MRSATNCRASWRRLESGAAQADIASRRTAQCEAGKYAVQATCLVAQEKIRGVPTSQSVRTGTSRPSRPVLLRIVP